MPAWPHPGHPPAVLAVSSQHPCALGPRGGAERGDRARTGLGGLGRAQKARGPGEEGRAEEGAGASRDSFPNVPLNQLNGPLVEQGPRKVGEMEVEAGAASSGRGWAAGQGTRREARKPASWAGGWDFALVPPDLSSAQDLSPPRFGRGENSSWARAVLNP